MEESGAGVKAWVGEEGIHGGWAWKTRGSCSSGQDVRPQVG